MAKSKTLRLIPAIASVGGVLPACSDPLVGDWEVTRYYGKVLPLTKSYGGATLTKSAALGFEKDGDAELIITKTYGGTKSGELGYAYSGTWERVSKGNYSISLDSFDALDCSLAGGELECDDPEGDRAIEAVKE